MREFGLVLRRVYVKFGLFVARLVIVGGSLQFRKKYEGFSVNLKFADFESIG